MIVRTINATKLDLIVLGHNGISFDSWTDNSVPVVTAGSVVEIGGSILEVTVDETVDYGNVMSGGATNQLYYIYADPITLVFRCSTTTPVWDDARNSYYATVATHTCKLVGTIFKTATSTYIRKNIVKDIRDLDFEKSYRKNIITGTIDCYASSDTGTELFSDTATQTGSPGTTTYAYQEFYLKKPITAWLKTTFTRNDANGGHSLKLQIYQNSAWQDVDTGITSSTTTPLYDYNYHLCPAHYRLVTGAVIAVAGNSSSNVNVTSYMYTTGCYGDSSLVADDIITLI